MSGLMAGLIRKNRLPARIRGWAGTATGRHIHVVHISHTHPPKELIQTQRIYLLGKNTPPEVPRARRRGGARRVARLYPEAPARGGDAAAVRRPDHLPTPGRGEPHRAGSKRPLRAGSSPGRYEGAAAGRGTCVKIACKIK